MFCAALICAVVQQFGGGQGQGMRRILCGVFLAAVLLGCAAKIDLSDAWREMDGFSRDAAAAVELGQEQASRMKFSIISEQCEAYIMNKAADFGAQVEVSVTLDPETGLPSAARITGALTPWVKQTLSGEITQALGIEKEALDWTN